MGLWVDFARYNSHNTNECCIQHVLFGNFDKAEISRFDNSAVAVLTLGVRGERTTGARYHSASIVDNTRIIGNFVSSI